VEVGWVEEVKKVESIGVFVLQTGADTGSALTTKSSASNLLNDISY
jgi:hypothetical protein